MPLDPKLNGPTRQSPHWQGMSALSRALIKFERWDEILKDGSIPWGDSLRDKLGRRYAEAMAHLGKKDRRGGARRRSTTTPRSRPRSRRQSNTTLKRQFEVQDLELRGSLALLKGDAIDGAHAADAGRAEGARAALATTTIRRSTRR